MVNAINNIELWNQVTPELQSGERLLWVGKPLPFRVMLANGELITSGVSLAMLVFMIFFFSQFNSVGFSRSSSTLASPFSIFSFFPLIFIGFGLLTLARPVYALIMATRTIYGLTDHRAIIITQTFSGRKVESYTEMDQLERTDIADGKGDLVFDRERHVYRSSGRRRRTRVRVRKIGFFGIENVREVEAMMLRSLKEKEAAY